MDLRELNEKLRRELLATLDGIARDKVMAEIEARDRFILQLESGVEVRCSCGLVMSQSSFYEHQKETRHRIQPEGEKMETCSCGLVMSSTNLREHEKETRHGQPKIVSGASRTRSFVKAKPVRFQKSGANGSIDSPGGWGEP